MDFKIKIDTAGLEKDLQTNITSKMKTALQSNIDDFFKEKKSFYYNQVTLRYESLIAKGDIYVRVF